MHSKQPDIPIAPILEALGFDNVPHLTSGHAKVRCHFHGERNPSASVSRYGFRCFGCERSGDAVALLREEEDLTYADALERAKELAGITDQPVRSSSWASLDLLGAEGD